MTIRIDKLLRSHRKTVSIVIDEKGKLIVKAPLSMPDEIIRKLVKKNENWIIDKRSITMSKKKPATIYQDGSIINLFEQPYALRVINDARYAMKLSKDNVIYIADDLLPQIKLLLEELIRTVAKPKFDEMARSWAKAMGVQFKQVKISSAKTRWGSCSNQGNINLNWKLALAPLFISNYIVVHELAHLKELNHSARFWRIVAQHIPTYKDSEKWLAKNGYLLEL